MTGTILVIAGSDPSGGAGLSRDIDTIARLGASARPVVTAVTAQTDRAVSRVACLPPGLIAEQLVAALDDGRPQAVKIGMLGNAAIVEAVADRLTRADPLPVVLDPVLAASSGRPLLDAAGRTAMLERLLPLVTLLTPNRPEAAALCGAPKALAEADFARQALHMLERGPRFVLLKGGHGDDRAAVDRLYGKDGLRQSFEAPCAAGSARGTGCTLASAIAVLLAQGHGMAEAVRQAKDFVLRHRFESV